ncbi:MAG: LysR family transcriptional regulator [bacterium]
MTLNQLTILTKVIELQSFSKAAEELYITQPAVSHSILNLENELGIKLIERGKEGLYPTEAGNLVLKHAYVITASMEQIKQEIASLGIEIRQLKIGSFGSISINFLPGIMRLFKLRYPSIELKIFKGTETEIRDWIASGTIDMGFITLPCNNLKTIPIVFDDMVAILSKNHTLAAQKSVSIEQLAENQTMITWNSNCQILVKKAFKSSSGKLPQWKYKVSNMGTMLTMIKEGQGIGIIPKICIPGNITNVQTLPLEPALQRKIGLASIIPFADLSLAASAFAELTKKWVEHNIKTVGKFS